MAKIAFNAVKATNQLKVVENVVDNSLDSALGGYFEQHATLVNINAAAGDVIYSNAPCMGSTNGAAASAANLGWNFIQMGDGPGQREGDQIFSRQLHIDLNLWAHWPASYTHVMGRPWCRVIIVWFPLHEQPLPQLSHILDMVPVPSNANNDGLRSASVLGYRPSSHKTAMPLSRIRPYKFHVLYDAVHVMAGSPAPFDLPSIPTQKTVQIRLKTMKRMRAQTHLAPPGSVDWDWAPVMFIYGHRDYNAGASTEPYIRATCGYRHYYNDVDA